MRPVAPSMQSEISRVCAEAADARNSLFAALEELQLSGPCVSGTGPLPAVPTVPGLQTWMTSVEKVVADVQIQVIDLKVEVQAAASRTLQDLHALRADNAKLHQKMQEAMSVVDSAKSKYTDQIDRMQECSDRLSKETATCLLTQDVLKQQMETMWQGLESVEASREMKAGKSSIYQDFADLRDQVLAESKQRTLREEEFKAHLARLDDWFARLLEKIEPLMKGSSDGELVGKLPATKSCKDRFLESSPLSEATLEPSPKTMKQASGLKKLRRGSESSDDEKEQVDSGISTVTMPSLSLVCPVRGEAFEQHNSSAPGEVLGYTPPSSSVLMPASASLGPSRSQPSCQGGRCLQGPPPPSSVCVPPLCRSSTPGLLQRSASPEAAQGTSVQRFYSDGQRVSLTHPASNLGSLRERPACLGPHPVAASSTLRTGRPVSPTSIFVPGPCQMLAPLHCTPVHTGGTVVPTSAESLRGLSNERRYGCQLAGSGPLVAKTRTQHGSTCSPVMRRGSSPRHASPASFHAPSSEVQTSASPPPERAAHRAMGWPAGVPYNVAARTISKESMAAAVQPPVGAKTQLLRQGAGAWTQMSQPRSLSAISSTALARQVPSSLAAPSVPGEPGHCEAQPQQGQMPLSIESARLQPPSSSRLPEESLCMEVTPPPVPPRSLYTTPPRRERSPFDGSSATASLVARGRNSNSRSAPTIGLDAAHGSVDAASSGAAASCAAPRGLVGKANRTLAPVEAMLHGARLYAEVGSFSPSHSPTATKSLVGAAFPSGIGNSIDDKCADCS